MSYPPPNPYDPHQQPGYGQQPSQPQHFTTDGDPYSRPDPYGQPGYPTNPPMSVAPGSVPPGGTPPPGQGYQPGPGYRTGQAFQPGQPAPAPPRGSSNTPLIATLIVIVVAVAAGAIIIGMTFTGGEEEAPPVADEGTSEEATPSGDVTTAPSPTPEETTSEESEGAVYRLPEEDECLEDSDEGFYVVSCEAESAYWVVVHIEQNPEDPDPEDQWHTVAAHNACEDHDYTNWYFTDTAVSAGREWDPEIDSITAIYCVREVE